ncbi:hypothetical protein J4226_03535 [Candidatus Pacearchaeota archaeon]|nr:hypothetical protein [Candidatus Pacearchaeota archaeon]
MVLITLKPKWARLLISPRERKINRRTESYNYLEDLIQQGKWDEVPPIWVTPNFIFDSILEVYPTIKPLRVYNGHHRLDKAIEHKLPIKAYVMYTPNNPKLPKEEKLEIDFYF